MGRRQVEIARLPSTCSSPAYSRAVGRQEDLWEPEQVEDLDGVVAVAAGSNYSLALREDGEVWSWGSTLLGRENSKTVRVGRVEELAKVVSISGGETHAAAVTEDGEVWVWGAAKGWGGKGEVSTGCFDMVLHICQTTR